MADLGAADFAPVNGYPDTWAWDGPVLKSTGVPIGVMRTRDEFINFELVVEWRHMKSAGNSGVFAWVPMKALDGLPPNAVAEVGHRGADARPRLPPSGSRKTSGGKPDAGSRPTATSSRSATRR